MSQSQVTYGLALTLFFAACGTGLARDRVDFGRDVRPLFQEHCVGCHGPSQQMGGMRLDRRSSAMAIRGGTIIGPGNSEASRLYLKLTGTKYGAQMPPAAPLKPEQIALIKAWIDQGAEWPDEFSGEKPATVPDARAMRLMDALRAGDRKAFEQLLGADKGAVNLRGTGGATPLMWAAVYGDVNSLRQLLDAGADVNLANDVGATALMWASDDAEKTRLLLERGANLKAVSDGGRSAFAIALGSRAPLPLMKVFLEHGLKLSAISDKDRGTLAQAGGNLELLRFLLDNGANAEKLSGGLERAFQAGCQECVALLQKSATKDVLNDTLEDLAGNNASAVRVLLDAGADARYREEGLQFTPLMYAAGSERGLVESVRLLLEHGAEVNAESAEKATALDFAKLQGHADVIALLKKAGAREGGGGQVTAPKPKAAESAQAAIERALPLLQRSDALFFRKTGCVSCHNNNLTAATVAAARQGGIRVDQRIATAQVQAIAAYLENNRERALQGQWIAGAADTTGYILLGLAEEKYPADLATDAMARLILTAQRADGSWRNFGGRPPMESSNIQTTATAMRVLQAYGIRAQQTQYDRAIQLAADWLAKAEGRTTEDQAFRLLGLTWSKADRETIRMAAAELIREQRADGGWAQTAPSASDAYATGEALVALEESGAMRAADPAYRRGVTYLMNSQLEDGSWYVRSRTIPFQPYFDAGFPYGLDQFISAAATNWATRALIAAR